MARTIKLTQGKVVIVDDEDFEWLSTWKWFAHKNRHPSSEFYAWRNECREDGSKTIVQMHVQILGTRPGFECDHIDGDGLNNRRMNLRHATHAQNVRNRRKKTMGSSPHIGVDYVANRDRWRARARGGKHLGLFRTETLALSAVMRHIYANA